MMPREQKYVLVMILTLAYLSAIRLNILSKRNTFLSSYMNPAMKKLSTFVCGYLDEPHLSMQNVCLLFIFFSPRLWYGMTAIETSCRNYVPNQGKEVLDVLPFAANGNDYLSRN